MKDPHHSVRESKQPIEEIETIALSRPAVPLPDAGGWILYDGECTNCTSAANRFSGIFARRGFKFIPFQTPWVQRRLGLRPGAPLDEMRVLTDDGGDFRGANAVLFLASKVWWLWPFSIFGRVPGVHWAVDLIYRWIAAHRGCSDPAGKCAVPNNDHATSR